jgi:hypothetical protein
VSAWHGGGGSLHRETIAGALFCHWRAAWFAGKNSLWPAGSRRLVEPLAGFKSWIGFEPITFRLLADERPLCDRSGPSIGSTESKRTDTLSNDARSLVAGMSFCLSLPLAALRSPDEVEHDRVLTALPRTEDGHDFRHDLTIPP